MLSVVVILRFGIFRNKMGITECTKKNQISMEYTLKPVLIITFINKNKICNDISSKNKIRMFNLNLCSMQNLKFYFLVSSGPSTKFPNAY